MLTQDMTSKQRQQQLEIARQSFKYMNKFMMVLWRLGLGKLLNASPTYGGRMMVIRHIGRKSGLTRYTPVNYTEIDGDIYCTAGFGKVAHWYKNIMANPDVEIWLPDSWWAGVAEDVTDGPNRVEILRQVLIASGFAASLFEGIDPRTMSEDALNTLLDYYRLVRIHRTEPRTGPGGPGEWAWVWPLLTFALLGWLIRPRR